MVWFRTKLGQQNSWTKSYKWIFWLSLCLLCACNLGIYHTVKPGQTLYRISRTYGVSETEIARANGISDPAKLRAGTRIYIPGADRLRYVPVVENAATEQKPSQPPPSRPAQKVTKKIVKTAKPKPQPASPQSTAVNKLQWPLRGKVTRSFSSKAVAGAGKGIEISVGSGTSVKAAEAGKVIYSGDGVNGYGHLVILQHENNLFTVYGFNQRNTVRQGDFVSKGERIALSGTPPAGGAPRLHFEVRKGKQAVNPILYLP